MTETSGLQRAASCIYPQRQQQGVIGYIARSAIDAILNGEQADFLKAVFVHERHLPARVPRTASCCPATVR